MPDVAPPEEEAGKKQQAPWAEIFAAKPFRKLLWTELFMAIALGGLAAFTKYLKAEAGMQANHIMLASAAKFVGALGTLWFLKTRLDRLGSRPVILFGLIMGLVCVGVFGLIAGKVVPLNFYAVAGLYLSFGDRAIQRDNVDDTPCDGHRAAPGQQPLLRGVWVVGNLAMGLSPTLWGVMIDVMSASKSIWLGVEWKIEYTLYFAGVAVVFLLTTMATLRLEETIAARLNELFLDLVRHSPLRVGSRGINAKAPGQALGQAADQSRVFLATAKRERETCPPPVVSG